MNGLTFLLKVNKVYLEDTKKLCFRVYPRHSKGCPNCYGKCWGSGKDQVRISRLIDFNKPRYIVFNEFDLEIHVNRLKVIHPDWSDVKCRCVLYWQSTARKQLREKVVKAFEVIRPVPTFLTHIPELYGVNVYKTCANVGLILDPIKNMKICRHVALLGYSLKRRR